MNISSDFFSVNVESPEKEEEDLRILNNINYIKKPSSIFHIDNYKKFKPKPKIESGKINSTILSAENKVKLLLSSFLHDLKTEQIKEETNSNINSQFKRKKTKIVKKKFTNKKKSSRMINGEITTHKFKKINTISGNKNEIKNDFIPSPPLSSYNKRKTSPNSKSIILNSYCALKGNIPNIRKNRSKNYDSGKINILTNNNIEKFEEMNRRKSTDLNFHHKEITSMNDIDKFYGKFKTNSPKFKKYKRTKSKFNKNSKKTFKPIIYNSLHSKLELNDIISEKLLKLTGNTGEGLETDEMFKETKDGRSTNNNNRLKYSYSYFNKGNNSNSIYCSNLSHRAKSEVGSPKKDFNINDSDKVDKTENINDIQSKCSFYNGKENFTGRIQRAKSHFSSKIFPVSSINKKKYVRIKTLKDLKQQIKNTIILRPDELNLTNVSDINSQNKTISGDKEKSQRSKINVSIDNKNTENSLLNFDQSIDKKLNKNKFDSEDEIVNNEINEYSNNLSDIKNENKNQDKKKFYSLGRAKTKIEIIKENFRILTNKKLVYDSLDDEEVEEEYNNKYINPDSLFIRIFDNLVSFLALSSLIYLPYYLASTEFFCKNYINTDFVVNIFVEIIYMLDFIFGFFKAYYNFEEQLITNNIAIVKRYLVNYFLLDLISALPIHSYLKIKESTCPNYNNIHKYDEIIHNLHYLFVLNKLLKIFKVNFITHNFIRISNKLGVKSTLLIQLIIFFSILHFFSCLYIFIGRNSYPNWILESKLQNSTFLDLYISSVYSLLASMTTVGFGDIVCHSFTERIFEIFLLIVGCLIYSWFVSSFSNYVKKKNEKSVDFEKRKQILDGIRCNYPKMPNNLYERTLRYLKYKNFNEKRDKNIIFDCLPIGLKNNLIYEMYKPIIKNFIFFKNFDNTDFIVRVILAFRPTLAYKNDVLLNEGDMVDDIFFVKKGVLSVQIPINIKNPEEYINKYLYGDIFGQNHQKSDLLNSENQTFLEQKNNNFVNSLILQQENNQPNFLNITDKKDLIDKDKKAEEEEKERKRNTRYIKIVSIRENEHFGDVLIFIDQRSPLRVKVTSKKAELFLLKKMDVVSISSSYQNIWRRINKRSVFNFEQIKKSIPKIVELYCRFKGFNVNKLDEKMTSNQSSKKNLSKKTMLPSSKLKMHLSTLKSPKKFLTQQYNNRKIFTNKYFPKEEDFLDEYKNIKTSEAINLHENILNNPDSEEEAEVSDEKSENCDTSTNNSPSPLNRKLINTYNRHYKYYVGSNAVKDSYKTLTSVIKEESEVDSSIIPLKDSNIIKNKLKGALKNSTISNNRKKSLIKSHFIKNKTVFKEKYDNVSQDLNETTSNIKRLNIDSNINENDETFVNKSKNIQSDTESIKKRRSNIVGELLSGEKQNSLIKDSINDEFNINEEIKIPINESLIKKCVSKSILFDEKNITPIQTINNISKQESEQVILSDKSLNKIYSNTAPDKNNLQINNSKLDNYKKIFTNENLVPDRIITDMKIKSIYHNLHSINNKYYLNKDLQKMIKQLLEEETDINDNNNKVKKSRSIGLNKHENKSINRSSFSNTNNSNNNNMSTSTIRKNNFIVSTLIPPTSINKNRNKFRLRNFYARRSSTFSKFIDKKENFNSSEMVKKKQKFFPTNIVDSKQEKIISRKPSTSRIGSAKRPNHNILRECSGKNQTRAKYNSFSLNKHKNDMTLNPNFFKKKKTNLLSTINFNIEKNTQNINNPNAFYSSYFQCLLENEKKKAERFSAGSMEINSQSKKNKK